MRKTHKMLKLNKRTKILNLNQHSYSRTAYMRVCIILYNHRIKHSTEQF